MAPHSEIPVGSEEMGAEFMTYLWHAGVSGEEKIIDKAPVRILLGDLLKLKSMDGSGAEVTLKGEHAAASPELFTALHRGALLTSARVQLDLNGTVIVGTLKATTLCLTAAKLPKDPDREQTGLAVEEGERAGQEKEEDRARLEDEARLLARMSWLDQAQGALDLWFADFLKERTDGRYDGWLKQFRGWIAESVRAHAGVKS